MNALKAPLVTALMLACTALASAADYSSGLGSATEMDETHFDTTSKTDRFSGNPGSSELDNGMVVKWGTIDITWGLGGGVESGTQTYVPVFDNDMLTLNASVENASGAAVEDISVELTTTPATRTDQFSYDVECFTCVLGGSATIRWQATGY